MADLTKNEKLAVFAGNSAHDNLLCMLINKLHADYKIVLCEDLSLPTEKILEITSENPKPALGNGRKLIIFLRA